VRDIANLVKVTSNAMNSIWAFDPRPSVAINSRHACH
jgi:hypothetical protein